jgi:hypothetical protein
MLAKVFPPQAKGRFFEQFNAKEARLKVKMTKLFTKYSTKYQNNDMTFPLRRPTPQYKQSKCKETKMKTRMEEKKTLD